MTLATIIETLKMIALKHPNVNSAYEGNIYEILNAKPDNKYASVVITQQSHTTDEVYDHYGFVIFYVDRLVDDMEDNRVQIQSCGKSMLGNIITFFCEEFDAECENISFQPFTQRFVDETAGIYSTITIDVPKDVICPEEYWNENWVAPVTVIRNQDKRVVFTENGTYTIDYDPTTYTGLGNVEVNVNIDVDSYYNQGKTDGISEQKSKLSQITISENGTYSKEDGYSEVVVDVPDLNGDYNEGYEQGQADVAANARVLNVTENGVYRSKYSEPIIPANVTGVYADGTKFYSYAELTNKVFNTNITVTKDSVVELWYKGDNEKTDDGWNTIFGCAKNDDDDFYLGYMYSDNTNLRGWIGQKQVQFSWDDNVWHHIIMKNDGLWIDDVLKGSFNTTKTFAYSLGLNGTWDGLTRNANGCYGMIKIDNTIIIPTADGFLNTNTGELIEVVKDGNYKFIENQIRYGEGELYKTINVNVIPKINVKEAKIKFAESTFTEVPEWADFKDVTDFSYMFRYCNNLQIISEIDTSNATNMNSMFNGCGNLTTVPAFDTSNVTDMGSMFNGCGNLTTVPAFDTSNVANMYQMLYTFGGNKNLVSLPKFNCQKVNEMGRYFSYYSDGMSALTDVGGWENLKCDWNDNYGLAACPNLTYQSCINILNGLYDFVGNGSTETRTLKVHPNFLTTVGDEISIGTLKGWTIKA